MPFNLEEVYGVTRNEFMEQTGTTADQMTDRLMHEVAILKNNLACERDKYRNGASITEDEQRKRAKLIKYIEDKINRKTEKVKDIVRNVT